MAVINYKESKIQFLEGKTDSIKRHMESITQSFYSIGLHLWEIRDSHLHELKGYKNIAEYALNELDFKRTMTFNLISIVENYGQFKDNRPTNFLKHDYRDFSFNQLVEMKSIDPEHVKSIDSTMSVRAIKEFKKQLKNELHEEMEVVFNKLESENSVQTSEQNVICTETEKQLVINENSEIVDVDFKEVEEQQEQIQKQEAINHIKESEEIQTLSKIIKEQQQIIKDLKQQQNNVDLQEQQEHSEEIFKDFFTSQELKIMKEHLSDRYFQLLSLTTDRSNSYYSDKEVYQEQEANLSALKKLESIDGIKYDRWS